ncbi:hypothetical protein KAI87_02265, partial [Myxococcota bacterium]|nr:hypothetical protein [Myxococcota bacterium]
TFTPSRIHGLKIREGCTRGGFVTSIDLIEPNLTRHNNSWTGEDLSWWNGSYSHGPTWLDISFAEPTDFLVAQVVIHTQIDGYEQIDTVLLKATDETGDACDSNPGNVLVD